MNRVHIRSDRRKTTWFRLRSNNFLIMIEQRRHFCEIQAYTCTHTNSSLSIEREREKKKSIVFIYTFQKRNSQMRLHQMNSEIFMIMMEFFRKKLLFVFFVSSIQQFVHQTATLSTSVWVRAYFIELLELARKYSNYCPTNIFAQRKRNLRCENMTVLNLANSLIQELR